MGDLYVYDPVAMAWTNLSAAASGIPPCPRAGHGFTAAGDRLYVHGGWGFGGENGDIGVGELVMMTMAVFYRGHASKS